MPYKLKHVHSSISDIESYLHFDDHLIAINKPSDMLSVPGKTDLKVSIPRYLEWTSSIRQAIQYVGEKASKECLDSLEKLAKMNNVPRKEKPFMRFLNRTIKLNDDDIMQEVWDAISSTDVHYHKVPLEKLPLKMQSAAEILEHKHGKIYQVHRLDCATSGVLLFGRTDLACSELCRQFKSREVLIHKLFTKL